MIRIREFTRKTAFSVKPTGQEFVMPVTQEEFIEIATTTGGVKLGMDEEEIADILNENSSDEILEGEEVIVMRRPDGILYAIGVTEFVDAII